MSIDSEENLYVKALKRKLESSLSRQEDLRQEIDRLKVRNRGLMARIGVFANLITKATEEAK